MQIDADGYYMQMAIIYKYHYIDQWIINTLLRPLGCAINYAVKWTILILYSSSKELLSAFGGAF